MLAYVPCIGVTSLLPTWLEQFLVPLWGALVVLPLFVWRMHVLDARELAAGRVTLPEPRELPAEAHEQAAVAQAAVVEYRRVRRNFVLLALTYVAFGLAFVVIAVWLFFWPEGRRGTEEWVLFPVFVLVGAMLWWWGLVLLPRTLRRAAALLPQIEAGSAARHRARVVEFDQNDAVIQRPGGATDRLVLRRDTNAVGRLVIGDEVAIIGDWLPRGIVVATMPVPPKSKGAEPGPTTKWLRTRTVEQVSAP